MRRFSLIVALCLACASCVSPRLEVDEVLVGGAPVVEQDVAAFPSTTSFDAAAIEARQTARAQPRAVEALVGASRALFLAANVRIQRSALDHVDALEDAQLDDVLNADMGVSAQLRDEVVALSTDCLAFAKLALEVDPEDRGALLYRAIGTSLLAWSVGNSQALFQGLGGQCKEATANSIEADEGFDGAAPLRLRGRFLTIAPWPLRDTERAVAILRRATELAPVTLNWLFLGDALHSSGDMEAARSAWQQAADSDSAPGSVALGMFHREFARRRLALSQ